MKVKENPTNFDTASRYKQSEICFSLDNHLKQLLWQDVQKKEVRGAHWFRQAVNWLRVQHGYNNPLNWGVVHCELQALMDSQGELAKELGGHEILFFGVGVGDTEMAVVDCTLKASGSSDIIGADVNEEFLRMFGTSLSMRLRELPEARINYRALRCLFEDLHSIKDCVTTSRGPRVLVCLGSTIGNYRNTDEVFRIFNRVSRSGDQLLLGYQLATHLPIVFEKYAENPYYADLVGNFLPTNEREEIVWRLNQKERLIEAWHDEVQLFRSKKFSDDEVGICANRFGWHERMKKCDADQNFCLHLLGRK
jgi:hypothetical protein